MTARLRAFGCWLRAHAWLVGFCAAVGLFYLWTIRSSSPAGLGNDGVGYYNLLTDAFVHGHLHLLVEPSPELLKLPHPFDPVANQQFAQRDLSLYNDHYYLYWGAAPAVVAFLPARIFGLGDLSQATAVFIFAFVGFCFSIATLRELVARFAPGSPRWMLGAGALVLAFGNALPFTLRRVEVYEVAITAGFCFCFIAMYLVVTALRDGVSLRRLAAASAFMGLAVASRPTTIVPALVLVGLAIWLWRASTDKADGNRIVLAAVGPMAFIGVLIAAYNAARFGNPLEFGQTYVLAGDDPTKKAFNQVSYIPPGAWYYLFSPPHLSWGFPFIQLPSNSTSYPFSPPAGYTGVEAISGLLLTVPFSLFAIVGLFVARGRTRQVLAVLCGMSLVVMLMVSIALWGATMRYEVDFASFLLIAAVLGWLVWARQLNGGRKTAVLVGGGCLAALAVVFGLTTSMTGYGDSLRTGSPGSYAALQRYTAPLPMLGSLIEGKPILLSASLDEGNVSDTKPGAPVGVITLPLVPGATADLAVVSGSKRRYGLALTPVAVGGGGAKGRITIKVTQTGDTHVLPSSPPAPTVVPVELKRGVNHILISATGATQLTGVRLVPQ